MRRTGIESTAINVPGQSGSPDSPHFADLATLWSSGASSHAGVQRGGDREARGGDADADAALNPALQSVALVRVVRGVRLQADLPRMRSSM
jgi:hypothetical protein